MNVRVDLKQAPRSSLERAPHVLGEMWRFQVYLPGIVHYAK
jgi:hypothetical protein